MISSTHILTGAALGLAIDRILVDQIIPDPVFAVPVAFVVGVVSHHILDALPHTDPGSFRADPNDQRAASAKEIMFALPDNILGTLIVLYVFFAHESSWPMLFGALAGNLPDVWHNVGKWSDVTRYRLWPAYFEFHERYHWTARGKVIPLGVLTNLVLILLSLRYLFMTIG